MTKREYTEIYQYTEKLSTEWSIITQGFKNYKICQNFSNSVIQNGSNSIISITVQVQNISVTTVLFHGNLELLVFSIILWQVGKDFVSRFTWPRLVFKLTHGFL